MTVEDMGSSKVPTHAARPRRLISICNNRAPARQTFGKTCKDKKVVYVLLFQTIPEGIMATLRLASSTRPRGRVNEPAASETNAPCAAQGTFIQPHCKMLAGFLGSAELYRALAATSMH